MLAAMLVACMAVALWLVLGDVAFLPWLARLALSGLIGLACLFAVWQARAQLQPSRLHIAAQGQISLAAAGRKSTLVQLLPGSTLWPHCLVLRLRDERGKVHVLLILPDSVAVHEFRALLVACRWIEARSIGVEPQNFF
jgi:toxin CptA